LLQLQRRNGRTEREMPEAMPLAILVVDHNSAFRRTIARWLTRQGCRVTTAADGAIGLEAVRNEPFDVVITDIHMPRRGGIWLYEQAVALRPELRGRFLLCTSDLQPEPHMMSTLHSEHFLQKPATLDAIWHQLQEIVRRGPSDERTAADDPPAETR
jgi:CheY-like chemotaxis protein